VVGAAIAVLRDGLKDAVVVVVQKVETGEMQEVFKEGAVAVDEIIIILVALRVLKKKGLPEQAVDHARHVAARFFGEGVEEGVEGHGLGSQVVK
ncbi:MAG: hypothetical protein AAB427_10400, partial [Chloroflexota bacterium]